MKIVIIGYGPAAIRALDAIERHIHIQVSHTRHDYYRHVGQRLKYPEATRP